MSAARTEVFAALRRALGVDGREEPRRAAVADRLKQRPPGPVPALPSQGDWLTAFRDEAERAQATVATVPSSAEVPAEAARFLRERNLPGALRLGADEILEAMPWRSTNLEISHGPSRGDEATGVSRAFAAAAETGTLALVSGPENPTSLNFLPENHIVVIRAQDVTGGLETIWSRLRAQFGEGRMPRALNLVTGPSRSADIEQTLLLGAHGPRRLHVIVIEKP